MWAKCGQKPRGRQPRSSGSRAPGLGTPGFNSPHLHFCEGRRKAAFPYGSRGERLFLYPLIALLFTRFPENVGRKQASDWPLCQPCPRGPCQPCPRHPSTIRSDWTLALCLPPGRPLKKCAQNVPTNKVRTVCVASMIVQQRVPTC